MTRFFIMWSFDSQLSVIICPAGLKRKEWDYKRQYSIKLTDYGKCFTHQSNVLYEVYCVLYLKGNDVQHSVFILCVGSCLKGSPAVICLNNYSQSDGLLQPRPNPKMALHRNCKMKNCPFVVCTKWIDLRGNWFNENIPQLSWNEINIKSGKSWQ